MATTEHEGDAPTEQWRVRLLDSVLRSILVVGAAVAVPSVWFALVTGQPEIALVDLAALGLVALATLRRSLPHRVRVALLLVTIHGLGAFLRVTVGSVGEAYLIGFVVLTALLLSTRAVLVALGVQALTLLAIGVVGTERADLVAVPSMTTLAEWLVVSANVVFVSGVIALGCSVLLRRVELSLRDEQQLSASLDERNRDLELAARQRAEARERQRFQAQLLDAVADAVAATDLDGRVQYLNPAAQRLYRTTSEDAVGHRLARLVTMGDGARLRTELLEQVRGGRTWSGETTLHLADGTDVPAIVTAAPVHGTLGEVTGLIGVATDVSELRDAIDRLNRSEEIRVAFLRATSHELRTPLAAIVGLTETLQVHGRSLADQDRSAIVERLQANAQRLSRLVTDLLDVDRLASGLVSAAREPHDLRELVLRSVAEVDTGERHVQLDLVPVHAEVDGPKLERVVVNLVANATRHTPPGTTITVRLRGDETAGQALLQVRDDGPGIDPGYLEVLFEPFVQGPERHQDASPGTGLGLSLARELARLHGGELTAHNVEPRGALFEVRIPLRAADAATDAPSDTTGAARA